MKNWKIQYGTGSLILVLMLLAVLSLFNFISMRVFRRVDLTQGKIYTLSLSTKEILKSLDDIVRVEVYFSKKLPSNLNTLKQQVRDLLEEYSIYSNGEFKFKFLDPREDPEIERKVARLGIPRVQMNVLEKDRVEVVQGYLGMGIFYEDKSEAISLIEETRNLEYDITSRILKLTRGEDFRVGFILGNDHSLEEDYSEVKKELEKQYTVVVFNGDKLPDPSSVNVLVVASMEGLSDSAEYAIDQYIMKGGGVIFLVDGIKLEQGLRGAFIDKKYFRILESYGIIVNRNVVLDRYNEMASFSSGFMSFFLPYPFWVKVIKKGFNRDIAIVKDLESLLLPWPSSLDTITGRDSVEFVPLVNSSPYSWTQTGFLNLNPQQRFAPTEEDRKVRNLAVLISGRFQSAFKDREPPSGFSKLEGWSPRTSLLVIGNSMFINDGFASQFPENMVFFMNAVDWMGFGEKLISIRSRGVTDRPLKELSDREKALFRIFNTYFIPICVVMFGVFKFYIRQREKRRGV